MINRKRRKARPIDAVSLEGFDPVVATPSIPVKPVPVKTQNQTALEKRLMDWRDTVLGNIGGCSEKVCASWASAYVAARNEHERQLAIALEIIKPESTLSRVDVDELDGWLIEAAVRAMIHFDQKQVLRLKFVWGYPNHFIKSKLKINDTSLLIVLGRALTNLQIMLDKLDAPVKIRSNNSHAGIVPRLEASAVPVGTPAPLESKEALID